MINHKVSLKLIGVTILVFASIFVCSIFWNYSIDLKSVEHLIETPVQQAEYDGFLVMIQIMIAVAVGGIGTITLIVLLFSIGRFIDERSHELGVLKALGYSGRDLSLQFAGFGLAVFVGAILGYVTSVFTSQVFYNTFDAEGTLPSRVIYAFHAQVPAVLITAPTILFSAASVIFAGLKLRKKPLDLINDTTKTTVNKLTKRLQRRESNRPFLKELGRNMLFSSLRLIFFVGFAAFIFAMLVQIAFTMNGIEGAGGLLLPVLFGGLGTVMGFTTLIFALSFMMKKNKKYMAMLIAYGYTTKECNKGVQ